MRHRTSWLLSASLGIAVIVALGSWRLLDERQGSTQSLSNAPPVLKTTAQSQEIVAINSPAPANLAQRVEEKGLDLVAAELKSDPATVSLAVQRQIELSEAARRMKWQAHVAEFADAAALRFGEAYGSVWIDVNDGDRVKLGLVSPTANDISAAESLSDGHSLREGLDVVPVRYSDRELSHANDWLIDHIVAANVAGTFPIRNSLSPDRNAVTLILPTQAALSAEQSKVVSDAKQQFGDMLDITYDDTRYETAACNGPYCDAPLRGGIYIASANFQTSCSGAFTARDGAGYSYLLTAGHCLAAYSGAWWTRDAGGNYREIGDAWNWIWGSTGDMGIVSVRDPGYWQPMDWLRITALDTNQNANDQYPIYYTRKSVKGLNVCSVGKSTGSHCGNVVNVGGSYKYDGYSFTVAPMTEAAICNTARGDSGGAIYTGKSAYGIVSGRATDATACRTLYIESTRAESMLGVRIQH